MKERAAPAFFFGAACLAAAGAAIAGITHLVREGMGIGVLLGVVLMLFLTGLFGWLALMAARFTCCLVLDEDGMEFREYIRSWTSHRWRWEDIADVRTDEIDSDGVKHRVVELLLQRDTASPEWYRTPIDGLNLDTGGESVESILRRWLSAHGHPQSDS